MSAVRPAQGFGLAVLSSKCKATSRTCGCMGWRGLGLLASTLLTGAGGFTWGYCFPLHLEGSHPAPIPCSQQKGQVRICQKQSKEASSGSQDSCGVRNAVGSL